MNNENKQREPSFKAPKFFWTLFWTSVVLFCLLSKIKIGIEQERELEEIKQQHIERTMREYAEYARKRYEEDKKLYQDSIEPISTFRETDSLSLDNYR